MTRASELISEIRQELAMLKKDYILYFAGTLKHEPIQKREYLEKRVKLLVDSTKMKASDLFLADNMIATVQSNFRQWDKQLERKENRIQQKLQAARESQKEVGPTLPLPPGKIQISNTDSQRDLVVRLYDDYIKLMTQTKSENHVGFGRFQSYIQSQTQKFLQKGANSVEFEVQEKEGKVVIKSKSH